MPKKLITLISVFLIMGLVFTGAGLVNEASAGSPKRLQVAMISEPASLDVHLVPDVPSYWVIEQTGNRLVRFNESMELEPELATSWEWIDDLTIEFTLREGVTFHNGEPFTAQDVKFTLERRLDPDLGSPNMRFVQEIDLDTIEVIDDYTIRFSTSRPFAPFLNNLAHSSGVILNQKAVEQYGDEYGQNPVGTGPFKFVEWSSGDYVLLERYENYWEGPAKVDELQFRFIEQASNRTIELETGRVHIAEDIAPSDLDRIDNHPNITLLRDLDLMVSYAGMNNKREPFNDVRVRQAMNYAVDTEALVEAVYEGLGQKAQAPVNYTILNPGDQAGEIKQYGFDPEKAKQLLAEAGYPDGFTFTAITDPFDQRVNSAEIVQAYLSQIGVTMNIEIVEWSVLLDRAGNRGDYDMMFLSWTSSSGDPEMATRPFYGGAHGAAGNRVWYQNDRVDELLELGMQEPEWEQRWEYYMEAQKIIAEEAPWIFIQFGEQAIGVRNEVTGFEIHPNSRHRFHKVDIVN